MQSTRRFYMRLGLVLGVLSSLCHLTDSKITADDFLVTGLEEVDPTFATFPGQMHAGLVSITPDINADDGKLMFWLFEPDSPKVDDSLVIWFNGGPGELRGVFVNGCRQHFRTTTRLIFHHAMHRIYS